MERIEDEVERRRKEVPTPQEDDPKRRRVEEVPATAEGSEVFYSICSGAGVCANRLAFDVMLANTKKEISEKSHPELKEAIMEAKLAEWQTVDGEKHAVRVLNLSESYRVRREKDGRVIDTRFVLTTKGDKLVKARWVARGFKDPDALWLVFNGKTSSPTVSANARTVALQLIASCGYELMISDIKGAFTESDPLKREAGPLFAKQPPGGIPGLHVAALWPGRRAEALVREVSQDSRRPRMGAVEAGPMHAVPQVRLQTDRGHGLPRRRCPRGWTRCCVRQGNGGPEGGLPF